LITVEAARHRILAAIERLPPEDVALSDALGRSLFRDLASAMHLPPFDCSAMDGFAVVAGPAAQLELVGESRAGTPSPVRLEPGQAIRISTGAVIPQGADAVVPVERASESGGRVAVEGSEPGAHIRRSGEDVRRGDLVLRAGARIGPAEIGVLASLGQATVECSARPHVAVLSNGDELVPPGVPLGPGQIHDSNAPAVAALAERAGADVVLVDRIADSEDAVRAGLKAAFDAADVVCICGGVSVGPHDHVKPALESLGVVEVFWGVRLQPGKPTWFGRTPEGKLAFGLPGNPVSAMVTFRLFAHPALRAMSGSDPGAGRGSAVLDSAVRRNPERDQAIRVRLRAADGGWVAEPTKAQGSHILTSMVGAAALAMIPAGDGELAAGERVALELL
jgi:molybdopterin molybdotransferase